MILLINLIIATTTFQNSFKYEQAESIKKLILNGTTYFYYPVTFCYEGFKTGVLYKNYVGSSQDMLITDGKIIIFI
ncbi:hypothetical protein H312_03367 [Anncaliia algerae PRA339]|uniref:Uncharacterized protein n=1 Tax=Anncaliia algerae PRA339 TaxID=1288291 RepID=A0A059EW29_9MICR|nr:hypothetical protein H312_03367 [Anncaliia algerae PRA339]